MLSKRIKKRINLINEAERELYFYAEIYSLELDNKLAKAITILHNLPNVSYKNYDYAGSTVYTSHRILLQSKAFDGHLMAHRSSQCLIHRRAVLLNTSQT